MPVFSEEFIVSGMYRGYTIAPLPYLGILPLFLVLEHLSEKSNEDKEYLKYILYKINMEIKCGWCHGESFMIHS